MYVSVILVCAFYICLFKYFCLALIYLYPCFSNANTSIYLSYFPRHISNLIFNFFKFQFSSIVVFYFILALFQLTIVV